MVYKVISGVDRRFRSVGAWFLTVDGGRRNHSAMGLGEITLSTKRRIFPLVYKTLSMTASIQKTIAETLQANFPPRITYIDPKAAP